MPQNPGNEPITFIHQSWTGTADRYGVKGPLETTSVVVGCALQPMSEKEILSDTSYAEATDKCLTPPVVDAVLATIIPGDYLADAAGVRYRILGIRPFRDGWGRLDHTTFVCKWEGG